MQGVQTAPSAPTSLRACPRPWLIGVLHLPALPGAPAARIPLDVVAHAAAQDALLLQQSGFTAVLVENYNDVPFAADTVPPETVAALTVVALAVRRAVTIPVGVNVLRNDALAGLAVAHAAGAGFQRVNVLAGAAATDQGLVQGRADVLLRRRAALGADVAILADVDVKHATSLDRRPVAARAADLVTRSGADAVLVTGAATGQRVDLAELAAVAEATAPFPTLAASGTDAHSLPDVLAVCAGAIVGSAIKHPQTGRIDPERAAAYCRRRHP